MTRPSAEDDLRVGDHVVLRVGRAERRAVVIEDRGHLGVDGHQVVAVRVDDEADTFEVRAEHLERLAA